MFYERWPCFLTCCGLLGSWRNPWRRAGDQATGRSTRASTDRWSSQWSNQKTWRWESTWWGKGRSRRWRRSVLRWYWSDRRTGRTRSSWTGRPWKRPTWRFHRSQLAADRHHWNHLWEGIHHPVASPPQWMQPWRQLWPFPLHRTWAARWRRCRAEAPGSLLGNWSLREKTRLTKGIERKPRTVSSWVETFF